jgi:hypothetical protein
MSERDAASFHKLRAVPEIASSQLARSNAPPRCAGAVHAIRIVMDLAREQTLVCTRSYFPVRSGMSAGHEITPIKSILVHALDVRRVVASLEPGPRSRARSRTLGPSQVLGDHLDEIR